MVVPTSPVDGCGPFDDRDGISGKIPLILRGGCMFIDKVSCVGDEYSACCKHLIWFISTTIPCTYCLIIKVCA